MLQDVHSISVVLFNRIIPFFFFIILKDFAYVPSKLMKSPCQKVLKKKKNEKQIIRTVRKNCICKDSEFAIFLN